MKNGDISDKTKTSVLKMQLNAGKGTKRSGRVGKEWKSNAFPMDSSPTRCPLSVCCFENDSHEAGSVFRIFYFRTKGIG